MVGRVVRAFSPSAEGRRALVKPLDEVDLALVLARARPLARAAATCERHVPVLVACVPERRVVVLQHDL